MAIPTHSRSARLITFFFSRENAEAVGVRVTIIMCFFQESSKGIKPFFRGGRATKPHAQLRFEGGGVGRGRGGGRRSNKVRRREANMA